MLLRDDVNLTRRALMCSPPVHLRRGYFSYLIGRRTRDAINEHLLRSEEALAALANPHARETPETMLDRLHTILTRSTEDRY